MQRRACAGPPQARRPQAPLIASKSWFTIPAPPRFHRHNVIPNERQKTIIEQAKLQGFVTVDALATEMQVTTQTIRRDITALCDAGVLARFHGGASFLSSTSNMPYKTRLGTLSEEKDLIAKRVAEEINDESSIFIDIGTSAEAVARQLRHKKSLRIVTNNLNVVQIFAGNTDFDITVTCGQLRQRDGALVGDACAEFIERFQLDFSILGVVSLSANGDILDFSLDETRHTQAILQCGRRSFVVADHSKFARPAVAKVAHLKQASVLVTDQLPDDPQWNALADWTQVVQVGKPA
jgi:DeoR family glycerol-3-phosphate regulon repressor